MNLLKFLFIFVGIFLMSSCKSDDRDGNDSPRVVTPDGQLNFRSTTGKGVVEERANTFLIPTCGNDRKLGYITAAWRTPLPAGATFTVAFNVWLSEGAKIVGYEDSPNAGRASLHFQRKSPDSGDPYALAERYYDRGYRQWSGAKVTLTPGDHVFSAVLTPDKWSNRVGFDRAREDPAYAGITLSGNKSAGHGVCMAAGVGYVTIYSLEVH